MQGSWGQPLAMAYPYAATPPGSLRAQEMMARSVPLSMVQQAGAWSPSGAPSGVVQAQFTPDLPAGATPPNLFAPPHASISPPGVPFAPGMMPGGGLQPAGGLMTAPGAMGLPGMIPPQGAVAAVGAPGAPGGGGGDLQHFGVQRTQVRFVRPAGMRVAWFTQGPAGPAYSDNPIEVPGRYNFLQCAIYRLKLTNIPGQPGVELYPTLEVVPANPRTEAFLAHSSVPVEFTPEDFRQVAAGNYLVKVIYLPSPQYQDVAVLAPGEIISTELPPGTNPITEALRRGDILLVIRMGNMDQEAPNTPAIGAPAGAGCLPGMAGMAPGAPVPGGVMPYLTPNGGVMGPTGPLTPPGTGLAGPVTPPAYGFPVPYNGPMPGMPATKPGMSSPGTFPTAPVPPAVNTGVPQTRLPDLSGVQRATTAEVPTPPGLPNPRLP
jgi:hypothetical protein